MRERFEQTFASLPPEGVAILGTNLSRARNISQKGLLPGTWYMVQPPTDFPLRDTLKDIYEAIEESACYAHRACNLLRYELEETENDQIPVLVVLKPLKGAGYGTLRPEKEERPIPKDNVLGIIELPIAINPGVTLSQNPLLKPFFHAMLIRIGNSLEKQSVIDFGGSRQSRKL